MPNFKESLIVEQFQGNYLKCYVKPIKDPLGVSPSKGNQGTRRGNEKLF